MRKYFRQAGYFAAILILLPYVVTILLNGRSSLAQDNGTSPYVTVKSDEKNRKISLDEYDIRLSCFGIISVSVRQFSPVSFLPCR